MREVVTMPHRMSATLLLCAAVFPAGAALAGSIDSQSFDQVERGRYLSVVGDCTACHTLPGSGRQLAGGRILETPFGSLLGPNITPDPTTGIGAWTDDEFVNAMTKGRGRRGTHLFPAMPYTYYTKISRDDALAIRAYLNTLPPVHNKVRSDQLPFPLNVRENMVAWDRLFFRPGEFQPNASKSAEWNHGAYLTEGLGHCGLCHTPKNELGADAQDRAMQGYALQGWFAADLTNDRRRGLGSWSVDDIAAYLKTGRNSVAAATGLMAEIVQDSTSKMSDGDLHAIAVYLKDRPGDPANSAQNHEEPTPPTPAASTMKIGQQIYADECAGCHRPDGKGIFGLFPALASVPLVQQNDPASLLRAVLRGTAGLATEHAPTAAAMPAFGWVLNDDQVAAVLTYIRNSWGNSAPAVAPGDASKARAALAERDD
jgi:mono/diheme cytochrome c family protein